MSNLLENKGLRDFLNYLEQDDLVKLAVTSTQKLINETAIENKDEAVEIILRHSTDALTVLNRKVIKKEILFQYMNGKGISVADLSTKAALISKLLRYWDENNRVVVVKSESDDDQKVKELANRFCEWFYQIFNEMQPMGEEHFFQDCALNLNLFSDTATVSDSIENNPREITELLFKTKCEHGIFLNPNLSPEGIKGKMDNHGLVLIYVCGTLHTRDSIVGVFDQIFGIARDPFAENNWKIKRTTLNLRSRAGASVPTLSSLESTALQLRES